MAKVNRHFAAGLRKNKRSRGFSSAGSLLVGVLQAYSKQNGESVKLRALMDEIQNSPNIAREEHPLPRRSPQLKADQVRRLVADYQAGMRIKELAEKYGIARETAIKHLHRNAVSLRKAGLTVQQVKEAARLYEQGDSLATVGRRMGVAAHTVRSRLVEAGVEMRSSHDRLAR